MAAGRTHVPVVAHERCLACGSCVHACPAWVFEDLQREKGSLRAAVARRIVFPRLPAGEKLFQAPPCVAACPLGQDVPGYLGAIARGDADGALEIVLRTNPLPSVLGRVCVRPCTRACVRGKVDRSPDVRGLKLFAATGGRAAPARAAGAAPRGGSARVAIIGAGPAGLAAASRLRSRGVAVTILEKEKEPGGLLRWGMSERDLPPEDLARDVGRIAGQGVELRLGIEVSSVDALPGVGSFDAVLIAAGAGRGSVGHRAGKGRRAAGVEDVVTFARRARGARPPRLGGHVVVEGHAPWAISAARTALRLGAGVATLVCPAAPDGAEGIAGELLDEARREGVAVVAPAAVRALHERAGRLAAVSIGAAGGGGRVERVPAALYVDARRSGEERGPSIGGEGVRRGARGGIAADGETLMTGRAGVFAAGDAVTGPRSVVAAVAMGVAAAESICAYLADPQTYLEGAPHEG